MAATARPELPYPFSPQPKTRDWEKCNGVLNGYSNLKLCTFCTFVIFVIFNLASVDLYEGHPISSENGLIKQHLLPYGVIQLYSHLPAYVWTLIIWKSINNAETATVARQLKTRGRDLISNFMTQFHINSLNSWLTCTPIHFMTSLHFRDSLALVTFKPMSN